MDIAAHMMNNNDQIAHYLSELLVRDYGTLYLTAAHAGAILVLEDYIIDSKGARALRAPLLSMTTFTAILYHKMQRINATLQLPQVQTSMER